MKKRYHWLANMVNDNKYRIGAEIGVAYGNTSSYLMRNCQGLTMLYAVDFWKPIKIQEEGKMNKGRKWDPEKVKKEFLHKMNEYNDRYTILEGNSWNMASQVEDRSLDFVFIDAAHIYESVKKDILAWSKKVKLGGLLSGHDYHMRGVQKAVQEIVGDVQAAQNNVWYIIMEEALYERSETYFDSE